LCKSNVDTTTESIITFSSRLQSHYRWESGLIDDFHLGKAARGAGQKRTKNFKQALQAATIEYAKPIEMRMDWK